ncbi:hypothetical protein PoB_007673100 [Plakobranchus ocellatus]|uniref:Uncharacterized protein n=1 Tax=Plakobranchus ocellatus TaxID=259542 RepID=A0AAV4E1J8_9GAST|nr:hypothetical protein PoB_007673100 [Plakobranchus ocellatus]
MVSVGGALTTGPWPQLCIPPSGHACSISCSPLKTWTLVTQAYDHGQGVPPVVVFMAALCTLRVLKAGKRKGFEGFLPSRAPHLGNSGFL